ncbi:four helix bundle protein [Gramella sp. AN32]|uniref:Four helix bundle protein n=1 Tax=Christiangramia antarctica TaxID=2058158 RepID=A0ABW5X0A3_9FLAO|nr:four helix bundle protein [Gramella sp. AN32]MCM4154985.1 four helix bundle protein [Gramella sp. AN32]
MEKFNFEELKVYQKALLFVDKVYLETQKFPKEEIYGLSSQFKRASISIALNIAEGAGSTDREFRRYLQIALNSTKECVVCLEIARRQLFLETIDFENYRKDLAEISRMITSLMKYLSTK